MDMELPKILMIFAVAAVYASVGHGGASGYLAVLALFGASVAGMSASALCLNLLVASIAWIQFARAGHFQVGRALPFLCLSLPAAFLGGMVRVSPGLYLVLLGTALGWAGTRLLLPDPIPSPVRPVPWASALPIGAAIGLLSGIVGIGGGVFLSPLMLFLRWGDPKQVAAVSACFILANSASGLAGRMLRGPLELPSMLPLVLATFAGGLAGSWLGARKLPNPWIRRILGIVLLTAAAKLLITSISSSAQLPG